MVNKSVVKIALSGRKYSGKDEFANRFSEEYGFYTFSFSDQLKRIGKNIFPFMKFDYPSEEKEELVVYVNPETGVKYTPRMVWQSLDLLPEIYPPIFVEMLDELMGRFFENVRKNDIRKVMVLIKDVRRPAELEYVKKQGFYLVYIDTDDERSFNEASHHKSEFFQDEIKAKADRVFFNSKNNSDWEQKVKEEIVTINKITGVYCV